MSPDGRWLADMQRLWESPEGHAATHATVAALVIAALALVVAPALGAAAIAIAATRAARLLLALRLRCDHRLGVLGLGRLRRLSRASASTPWPACRSCCCPCLLRHAWHLQ